MTALVWDVDPIIFRIGRFAVGYYGLLLTLTVFFGYYLFEKQMLRCGCSRQICTDFLLYAVIATFVGARLVHCFVYHPARYLQDPAAAIRVWKGGISSHGATIGLITVAIWFSRKRGIPFLVLGDGIVFAAAVGATLVRIGNFFNSEIIGRVTAVPWAVVFIRRDSEPRHPSQLYEALGGLAVLVTLLVMSSKARKPKPGLFTGVFLAGYFTFRFLIEFVKEYHTLTSFLTMGQYLSIPFLVFGVVVLIRTHTTR